MRTRENLQCVAQQAYSSRNWDTLVADLVDLDKSRSTRLRLKMLTFPQHGEKCGRSEFCVYRF